MPRRLVRPRDGKRVHGLASRSAIVMCAAALAPAAHAETATPIALAAISTLPVAVPSLAVTTMPRPAESAVQADPVPAEIDLSASPMAEWQLASVDEVAPRYGPEDPDSPTDDAAITRSDRYRTLGSQLHSVRWEIAAGVAYMTAYNLVKLHRVGARSFHFIDEGWFGRNTFNGGMDKLNHAFNAYMLADILEYRIRKKTGIERRDAAVAGALIGFGLQFYSEFYDGIKNSSGWGWNDVAMNAGGAAFSVLRNTVPGLRDKVDFRIEVKPNENFYTFTGTNHYEQQRFLFAFQLAGWRAFENSPLRFVELHLGYYTSGFSAKEQARGEVRDRRPFVGIGLNFNEIFFRNAQSRVARAASSVLDYFNPPYTSLRYH